MTDRDAVTTEIAIGTYRTGCRGGKAAAALLLVVMLLLPLGGCGAPPPGGGDVVVLVSGTATEPQPSVTDGIRAELADAARRDSGDAGTDVVVRSADGQTAVELPLTPRRDDGTVEYGLRRDELIDRNLTAVEQAVAATATRTSGLDLLRGVTDAVRGRHGGLLVVLSNGLSTAGALDLRALGWEADPETVARELARMGQLEPLTGFRVIFAGLGETAGDQPALPKPSRDRLIAYWRAICTESGALSCAVDETPSPARPPVSTVTQPVVACPGVSSVRGPDGVITTSVTDSVLGFAGDHWELSPDGLRLVDGIAEQIRARTAGQPDRGVSVTGYTADPREYSRQRLAQLAQARADTVAGVLRRAGIPTVRAVGAGPLPGMTAQVGDAFDEAVGAVMRRVEIRY